MWSQKNKIELNKKILTNHSTCYFMVVPYVTTILLQYEVRITIVIMNTMNNIYTIEE
jgi:hypothetical protein